MNLTFDRALQYAINEGFEILCVNFMPDVNSQYMLLKYEYFDTNSTDIFGNSKPIRKTYIRKVRKYFWKKEWDDAQILWNIYRERN